MNFFTSITNYFYQPFEAKSCSLENELVVALAQGNEKKAIELIRNKNDLLINKQVNINGYLFDAPLWFYVLNGNRLSKVLEYCLTKGFIDVNWTYEGAIPLAYALFNNNSLGIDILIEQGSRMDQLFPEPGKILAFQKACGNEMPLEFFEFQTIWECSLLIGSLEFETICRKVQIPTDKQNDLFHASILIDDPISIAFILSQIDPCSHFINFNEVIDTIYKSQTIQQKEELFFYILELLKHYNIFNECLHKQYLNQALREGNSKIAKYLLQGSTNTLTIDEKGLTPLMHARLKEKSKRVNDEIYQLLKKQDCNFTSLVKQVVLFGYKFSLKGNHFEGFHRNDFFIKSMIKDLRQLLEVESYPSIDRVISSLEAAVFPRFERSINLFSNDLCTLIPCKWVKHSVSWIFFSVSWIFFRDICVKINLGDDAECPGINFFSIAKLSPEKIKEMIGGLCKIRECNIREDAISYFNKEMDQEHDLNHLFWIEQERKSGNCGWDLAKLALLALFILYEIKPQEKIDSDTLYKAYHSVKKLYSIWEDRVLVFNLKQIEPTLKSKFLCDLIKIDSNAMIKQLKDKYSNHVLMGKEIRKIWPD